MSVYVPCTYVLDGPSDIMRDNGHISYILWMSDYTLYLFKLPLKHLNGTHRGPKISAREWNAPFRWSRHIALEVMGLLE